MKTEINLNLDYEPDAAYYGDCADIMTAWKEKGVQGIIDLIYLDPPFNSNRNYGAPTSKSRESDTGSMDAFTDMWTYDEQSAERVENILKTQAHPARELFALLKGYLLERDAGMLAYLSYLADRLWLCRRLLKETGSIYLHCDPFANYYIRLLMDAIFGAKNFRNEIIWSYRRWTNASRYFQRMHDTILCYGKSVQDSKTQSDPEFKTKFNKLMEPKAGATPKYKRWNEIDKKTGKLVTKSDKSVSVSETAMRDVWEISWLQSQSKERCGFPTQKPLTLLDRIIKASSNEGDVVLDPFCGCGTTLHSAINNNRRFIGIDISVFSIHSVTHKRIILLVKMALTATPQAEVNVQSAKKRGMFHLFPP